MAEAIITELQAQLSMALSSASRRPSSPSNINLMTPRHPKKPWGSPRPPAPGSEKLLIRESGDKGGGYRDISSDMGGRYREISGDRGGGYREMLPASGQKSVSKVSMLLVPARKRGEEEEKGDGGESISSAGVVAPPTESSAAAVTAARREPEKSPERGRGKERPTNKDSPLLGEEKQDGDDIPELLPRGGGGGGGSEVTSGDVWGMLDSYVHRRSEVARANRHLGAIEAMRKVSEAGARCESNSTVTFHVAFVYEDFFALQSLPFPHAVPHVVVYVSSCLAEKII